MQCSTWARLAGLLFVQVFTACATPNIPVPPPPGGIGWHTESQGFISTTQSSSTSVATYGNLQVTTYESRWSQSAEGLRTRRPLKPAEQAVELRHGDVVGGGMTTKRGGK